MMRRIAVVVSGVVNRLPAGAALLPLAAALLLAGCATAGGGAGATACIPPDAPLSATLIRQIRGGITQSDPFAAPGMPPRVRGASAYFGLVQPVQLATSAGEIFVADIARRSIVRIAIAAQSVSVFAPLPAGRAGGLYVDRWLSVYVGDPAGRRVVQYARDGRQQQVFQDPSGLLEPIDVVADEVDRVYVADAVGTRVVVFDRAGHIIDIIGERVGRPKSFSAVSALAVGPQGLYLLDKLSRKVHVLQRDGIPLSSFGAQSLNLPGALAVDRAGRVFVADEFDNQVKVFEPDRPGGTVGAKLGGISGIARLADIWVDDVGILYLADAASAMIAMYQVPSRCRP